MKRLPSRVILTAAAVTACLGRPALAQSHVYSVAIYSGGTSYSTLCCFDIPIPPYHFKLTERSRYENADGLVIINVGHERELGGVLCRYLDVEYGSLTFTVWLDRAPPRRARELAGGGGQRKRRLKAWLDSGCYQIKTFTLSNRTHSLEDQGDLFRLVELERHNFHDVQGGRGWGPEPGVIRITASTNDMPIWDRIMREFDKPRGK